MSQAVDAFLKTILRSGLLSRDQLQDGLRAMPIAQRDQPDAVAEHLIKTGQLTRFQSEKLLKGTARGLILGHFQILAPVGKGGMSTVYLARDARSGRLLALKVLPPKRAREEERMVARFLREMELSRRVAHPHIALTSEVGVLSGVYYIAMEYVPGKSLHRLIQDGGPLPVPRAARLFVEVASALEHAHAQGLIHRDMKPSNIMITPNDHAKVLDFGLALMEGEAVTEKEIVGGKGYIVGSMDYISPEQTRDASAVDTAADMYSLGCSLFFTLTGRAPFPGGGPRDKIQRHRGEEPAFLTTINPSIPPRFAALVKKMMSKDPGQRVPSAAQLRKELQAWAPRESATVLDMEGDTNFQQAVRALEAAQVAPEFLGDVLPPPEQMVDKLPPWLRDYAWVIAVLGGFWLVLFCCMGMAWAYRLITGAR